MPKQRKSNGGGWSTGPDSISPGYLINQQYGGPGKDCAGVPVRPGYMDMYSSNGLPGLRGGASRSTRRRTRGGTMLQVANFANYADAIQPVPAVLPQTHGGHGVPPQPQGQMKGGRYEINPGFLNNQAIGASGPAPFGRIACETGSYNALNGNREVQLATTAIPISGGRRRTKQRGHKRRSHKRRSHKRRGHKRRHQGGAALQGAPITGMGHTGNFPVVHVGAADSMRYNAPTAGYRNDFEALPSGGAVPGLTLQTPYDARGSNLACSTTGGSRRNKNRVRFGGAANPADDASPYSALSMDQVMNRSAFDGSKGGLPVKYGGRRTRRHRRK